MANFDFFFQIIVAKVV